MSSSANYNTDDTLVRQAVATANGSQILAAATDPTLPESRRKSLSLTNLSTVAGNFLLVNLSSMSNPDKTIPEYQFRIAIGDTWRDTRATVYQGVVRAQFLTTDGEVAIGYEE